MVLGWLKTSLQEHNFGLTPTQWDQFWQALSTEEQTILMAYKKEDQPTEALARRLKLRARQIQAQWVQIYLRAQELRTQGED